ncbi:cell division protein FtsX [Alteromonadales bacterium alter-6D02]|nr:cell division protein FtsX [Alteromonadales bacterium alter-6D02]
MFFIRHLQQALASLGELWRVPASSLLTMAVLGVSLSLPTTLHVLLKNGEQLRSTWDNAAEVSLFLKEHVSKEQAAKAVNRIKLYPQVSKVIYVSQEQALTEFKQLSGFGEALSYLDSNPLPAVILVTPTSQFSSPEGARELLEVLEQQNEVAFGKLDVTWLEKLSAIVDLLKDAVFALGFLLLLAVTLVIANTIRLSILNRREEIEILKLVGATDNFIRRPFLYTGFWYGLIGGVIAWVCVSLMLWSLEGALSALANELDTDLMLDGLAFSEFLILIVLSAWLGWLGAYFSVTRHVNEIEPENQM